MENEMIVAVYSRKSRFTCTGDSVENQVETCCEYAKYHFIRSKLIFEVYEDEGFSGSTMQRPAMDRLMKKAKMGFIDVLVCYRLDRVSRSVSDFAKFIEQLNKYGIKFISVRENFDTTTPMGRAMIHIASVFAQLERETIAERIADNMMSLARTGRWLGGETPTGYRSECVNYIDNDGRTRSYFRLVIIDEQAECVKYIYKKYLELGSMAELKKELDNYGVLTKNHVEFCNYSLRFILENPVYCCADSTLYEYLIDKGYQVYSDKSQFDGNHAIIAYNRSNGNSKINYGRIKDRHEWILAVGEHTGVIKSSDWIMVQNQLESGKKNIIKRKPYSSRACLSGILKCKCCGSFMRPKTTGTINSDGTKRFYYMCELKSSSHGGKCSVINVQGNMLDEYVCSTLSEMYKTITNKLIKFNPKLFKRIKNEMMEIIQESNDNHHWCSWKDELKGYDYIQDKINRLLDLLSNTINLNASENIIKSIEKLYELQIKNNYYKKIDNNTEPSDVILNDTERYAGEFNNTLIDIGFFGKLLWESLEIHDRVNIIRKIVDIIEWDGNTAHIYLKM